MPFPTSVHYSNMLRTVHTTKLVPSTVHKVPTTSRLPHHHPTQDATPTTLFPKHVPGLGQARWLLPDVALVKDLPCEHGRLDDALYDERRLADAALIPRERRPRRVHPVEAAQQVLVAPGVQVVIVVGGNAVVVDHATGVQGVAGLLAGAAAVEDSAVFPVPQHRRDRAKLGFACPATVLLPRRWFPLAEEVADLEPPRSRHQREEKQQGTPRGETEHRSHCCIQVAEGKHREVFARSEMGCEV